jgi:hypothetical protein
MGDVEIAGWRALADLRDDHNRGERAAAGLQDRMPVIIERSDWPVWLGEVGGDATRLLRAAPDDVLRAWQVDKKVGNVRNDGPELPQNRATCQNRQFWARTHEGWRWFSARRGVVNGEISRQPRGFHGLASSASGTAHSHDPEASWRSWLMRAPE